MPRRFKLLLEYLIYFNTLWAKCEQAAHSSDRGSHPCSHMKPSLALLYPGILGVHCRQSHARKRTQRARRTFIMKQTTAAWFTRVWGRMAN